MSKGIQIFAIAILLGVVTWWLASKEGIEAGLGVSTAYIAACVMVSFVNRKT